VSPLLDEDARLAAMNLLGVVEDMILVLVGFVGVDGCCGGCWMFVI